MIQVLLLGHRKRAGKDTLARFLVERHGFIRLAYADKLKDVVCDLFRFNDEQREGSLKEVVDPRYGFTPRHAFQIVGTEHMRSLYPKVWTDYLFLSQIPQLVAQGHEKFAITDLRFENEHLEAIEWEKVTPNVKVTALRIDRPSLPPLDPNDHISETALGGWKLWNGVLINDGTEEELYHKFISSWSGLVA